MSRTNVGTTAGPALRALVGSVMALCSSGTLAFAQASPTFVVATIKPAPADARGQLIQNPSPDELRILNMSLQQLVGFAYGTGAPGALQVSGGPNWIDKDRYVVEGKSERAANMTEFRAMLKALLIERFALKTHMGQKETNVFELILARPDKKLGPKIMPWDGTCPGDRPPQPQAPRCAALISPMGLNMNGVTMATLATMLSLPPTGLGRPVVDKTGLNDEYTYMFEYQFAPPGGPNGPGPTADPGGPPAEPLPPALGTALEEQLGVKLRPAKGMIDVLTVDAAEHPSEN